VYRNREETMSQFSEQGVNGGDGSLSEAAYRQIKRAIIRCDLEPGQQVSEEQLAVRFQLGRAAVRPALKRLYQEHLIQTITRNRYVVSAITLKDAHNVYDLRLLLEPEAAKRAATRITPEQVQRLVELSAAQYSPGDRESAERFLLTNTEFHITIARASGNEMLAEVIANVLDRAERLNNLSHILLDRNHDAQQEHLSLTEALAQGDRERAEQEMIDQIRSARMFVIEALTSSPSIQTVNVGRPVGRDGKQRRGQRQALGMNTIAVPPAVNR
jgi:DNA-binding GntR family transcriptional regulator